MAHGELIDGVWHTRFHNTKATGGRFQRGQPKYRNWVTADGSPGPSGSGAFAAARGRYHLYVSLACPWAHRAIVFRKLKGLEDVISMDVVEPVMGDEGWQFGPDADNDSVNHKKHLHEIYTMADPRYTGRSSVPILWDMEQRTIVNNELPEIIRMLNSAFDAFTNNRTDYYPAALRGDAPPRRPAGRRAAGVDRDQQSQCRIQRAGVALRPGSREQALGTASGFGGQHRRALQEGGRRRQAPARLRSAGRALELLGDVLVRPRCRLRPMPGAAVGIDLRIGDLSQRAVHYLSLLS